MTVSPSAVAAAKTFIKKVDHTGITVTSLERSLDFWVGVLGFKHLYTTDYANTPFLEGIVGVPGAALKLAMVEGPGHNIELLEYSAPDERGHMEPRSCDVGSVHLAFLVLDIDSLLKKVAEHGWHPPGALQHVIEGERKGLKLAYVRGPDGVMLEFLEFPEN
ncbi:MAG: VOC family protein [Rhizobium sp.]|uniref:VOC family protein n=1 Tax=Rhizobium sp. TaxID=391 RepID=UPI00389B2E0D